MRDSQHFAYFSYLVLKEVAERLNNAVELDILRSLDLIVMSFNYSRAALTALVAFTAFDTVGVNSALSEKASVSFLTDFIPEYLIELRADNLAFLLGVGNTPEFFQELLLTVYSYEIHIEKSGEGFLYEIAFVLSHESLIDENAGELFSDCAAEESCRN